MQTTSNDNNQAEQAMNPDNRNPQRLEMQGPGYEIRVRGQLGQEWSDWFEGLELQHLANGEMVLSGQIVDQAALIGILMKLNRLNLALVSVQSTQK